MRQVGSIVLKIGLFLFLLLVCLEGVLRILPVHDGMNLYPVTASDPIIHYRPNRLVTWSVGPTFHMVNKVRVNNYGFVCDEDYTTSGRTPLLGIVGDSYIEAVQLPYKQTLAGRLSTELEDTAKVYPFAISGAPLSQYLVDAEYATHTFHANALVINIVGSDFDESLLKYQQSAGHHYFDEAPDGRLFLKRVDYKPSRLHNLVRGSALARYLLINADVMSAPRILGRRWEGEDTHKPRYDTEEGPAMEPQRIADSKRAVRAFLDLLPTHSGLSPKDILFVIDGVRPSLYDEEELKRVDRTYFGLMRNYFIAEAAAREYEVVDLQARFVEHYRIHGQRFEMPITMMISPRFGLDNHWSPLGHEVAFEGVKNSRFFRRFVTRCDTPLLNTSGGQI